MANSRRKPRKKKEEKISITLTREAIFGTLSLLSGGDVGWSAADPDESRTFGSLDEISPASDQLARDDSGVSH